MAHATHDAGDATVVGEEEVSDEQAEGAHGEDGTGKVGGEPGGIEAVRGMGDQPGQHHDPVDEAEQLGEY